MANEKTVFVRIQVEVPHVVRQRLAQIIAPGSRRRVASPWDVRRWLEKMAQEQIAGLSYPDPALAGDDQTQTLPSGGR